MPTLVQQSNGEEENQSLNSVLKDIPDRCETQNGQRTSCSCLSAADKPILCQLIQQFRNISYDNANLKHYFGDKTVLDEDIPNINLPFRFQFCQQGSDFRTKPAQIILCWNGTARLFFLATNIPYDKFSIYLCKDETRRTIRRKMALFEEALCLAQYKAKRHLLRQPGTKVDWSDVCFADLTARQKRSIGTLKKDCCHFGLKSVVDEHLLFAVPHNDDCDKFLKTINGHVVYLSNETALLLQNIRIRANELITSVATTEITLNPKESQADPITNGCGGTATDTERLRDSIYEAFKDHIPAAIFTARAKAQDHGTETENSCYRDTGKIGDIWSSETTIVLSSRYRPEEPRRKSDRHPLHARRPTGYIAVAPLSQSGCIIQLWPTMGLPGRLLFLPLGSIVVLPADAIFGEGFLTSMTTKNLRLQFYIKDSGPSANASTQPVNQFNPVLHSRYPQSPSLHLGTPLAKMLHLDG